LAASPTQIARCSPFVDSTVWNWFCYDDGRHWAVMIVTDAASRQTRALGLLLAFAPGLPGVIGDCDRWLGRVTAITWESHPDPAAREAELHAEHLSASGQRAAA
jgi:hypothetical protein